MVDHDSLVAFTDLVANSGFDRQLSARHEAEPDFVARSAANPSLLGDARHRGETHAGRPADNFKNARDCRDILHGSDIRAEVGRHNPLSVNVPAKR
jgi:hypothetical protein